MAAYDQGGGCACGISRVCDCAHAEKPKLSDDETMRWNRLNDRDKAILKYMEMDEKNRTAAVMKLLDSGILYIGPKMQILIHEKYKGRA